MPGGSDSGERGLTGGGLASGAGLVTPESGSEGRTALSTEPIPGICHRDLMID
jgi:hypothetical protein